MTPLKTALSYAAAGDLVHVNSATLESTSFATVLRVKAENMPTLEFAIFSSDPNLEETSRFHLERLVSAAGLPRLTDAGDLVGRAVPLCSWADGMTPAPRFDDRASGKFVYVIATLDQKPLCKVGIANSPEKRLKQLSTASPHNLRLEFTRHSPEARAVEQAAHLHFHTHRRNGEWFEICPTDAIQFINSQIDGRTATQWQN